jgi:hypothetical protein
MDFTIKIVMHMVQFLDPLITYRIYLKFFYNLNSQILQLNLYKQAVNLLNLY